MRPSQISALVASKRARVREAADYGGPAMFKAYASHKSFDMTLLALEREASRAGSLPRDSCG